MRSAFGITAALLALVSSWPVDSSDQKYPALEVGSLPHGELGRDVDGNEIRLADHLGKVVIVSFWASWCEPCKKELPVLAGLAKRVGPEHMKIIAINFKDDYARFKQVAKILEGYPITMLRDKNSRTARRYEVHGIPRMIVIGRDGKVASDHTGYGESALPELVEELNRLLAAGS